MAIGPRSISSIQYLENAEGVVVISDLSELSKVLKDIVQKQDQIIERATKLNNFARANHDIAYVRNKLKSDFRNL